MLPLAIAFWINCFFFCLNSFFQAAIDLLTTAVENAPNDDSLSIILEQAASLNIEIGNNRAAVEFLQRLYKLRPNDVRVLSQLIKAYSSFDPCRAEELLTNAFPEKNSSNMDVAALERAEWILYGERYKQKKEMKPEFTDTVRMKLRNYFSVFILVIFVIWKYSFQFF